MAQGEIDSRGLGPRTVAIHDCLNVCVLDLYVRPHRAHTPTIHQTCEKGVYGGPSAVSRQAWRARPGWLRVRPERVRLERRRPPPRGGPPWGARRRRRRGTWRRTVPRWLWLGRPRP